MNPMISVQQHLQRIGSKVADVRLSRNITQTQLGELSSTSRNTIRRLEAGETVSLENFIRVLMALKLDQNLDVLLPDVSIRPIERIHFKGHERQRARPGALKGKKVSEWKWGDET